MTIAALNAALVDCRRCPRLVEWREQVAVQKKAAFKDWDYWGRPVPGFGDPEARLLLVGLAPAAHGANRTGRMFTGDRSGDWLYRALWKAGFANHATSNALDDGLALTDCYVTASVHCAPPANQPTSEEKTTCADWLTRELGLLDRLEVIVALGQIAYVQLLRQLGQAVPRPRPKFAHLAEVAVPGAPQVIASYHPSQQNTFTGRLTEDMFDAVFTRANQLVGAK